MNTHLRRIVISTAIAISATVGSATISHSQLFPSKESCEADCLVRFGRQCTCYRVTVTRPSRFTGGSPRGSRTSIEPRAKKDKQRALRRENESANLLAQKGYDVEQNPRTLPNGKNPDYLIEGRTFDNLAPKTPNSSQIRKGISRKVGEKQTDRIILNMNDSPVKLEELRDLLARNPIKGLKEIIVVRDGEVIQFFP